MAGFTDREKKRTSVVSSFINEEIDSEKDNIKPSATKENSSFTQKSYIITKEQNILIATEAARTGKDKSAIVREALDAYLKK